MELRSWTCKERASLVVPESRRMGGAELTSSRRVGGAGLGVTSSKAEEERTDFRSMVSTTCSRSK